MQKLALLIGVSEYELGLEALPSAVRDIKAVHKVLINPEMGGFAEEHITVLANPERQTMEEAIEVLFSQGKKDDLVLLFFSGHGIKDDAGTLYLSSRRTRKNSDGGLIRSTAVSAKFIQDVMNRCRAKRQVVILDCCFSGAFVRGMLAKDDRVVDIKGQLGGEGRVILTSSASTQYSFEDNGDDLSIYTKYLVEGIETGVADEDKDGKIAANELHDYVKRKVQESAPTMKPEFHPFQDGFKIYLANAPANSPELQYRRRVEKWIADRGEISGIARTTLDITRTELSLPEDRAYQIEQEVLRPYRTHLQNIKRYEYTFLEEIQKCNPLGEDIRSDLKKLQDSLGISNEDARSVEHKILGLQENVSTLLKNDERKLNRSITRKVILHSAIDITRNTLDLFKFIVQEGSIKIQESFFRLKSLILHLQVSAANFASGLRSTRGFATTGILLILGGSGIFLYTSDRKAEETFNRAKVLQLDGNFSICSEKISSIPFYTRFSIKISKEAQNIYIDCVKRFEKEKFMAEQARKLFIQITSVEEIIDLSNDENFDNFEKSISYLNQISDASILRSEVDNISSQILAKLQETYVHLGRFDRVMPLVKMLPEWSEGSEKGIIWVDKELPKWLENLEYQETANKAISEALKVMKDLKNPYRLDVAREHLHTTEEQLKNFSQVELTELWKRVVKNINANLEIATTELNLQENRVSECQNQARLFVEGNLEAINNILFRIPNLRDDCNAVGISLPSEDYLDSVLADDDSICIVIASVLSIRSNPSYDALKIGKLNTGMLVRRMGKDFEPDSNNIRWIKIKTEITTTGIGWIAAMEEGKEYVSNCLTSWENIRGNGFRF